MVASRAADPDVVRRLLEPQAIAIVGASKDPARIGGRPVAYLQQAGFAGRIYPVNPNRAEIQGLKAYPSVSDLPEAPDLAIIALPAAAVPDAIDACGARGIATAIVFSAGFAETGEEGRQAQELLLEKASARGIRILGPNCLGAINLTQGMIATFSTSIESGLPTAGGVGFVTQSGAFGSHCVTLARERGLGVSRLITTGNEADIDVADCLAYLADDPDTRVIGLYMEGCGDGKRLKTALDRVQLRGKPVVALKAGESALGAEAAISHTASLAGADEAYDALFRRYPVHRAHSIPEFIDVAHAASMSRLPTGTRLGVITISGGVGILVADAAEKHGLDVAPLPPHAQDKLKALWPPAAVRNPVDTTAQAVSDPDMTARFLEVMVEEGQYDVLINFLSMLTLSPALAERFRPSLQALRQRHPDRLFILSAMCTPEIRREFEADGFLIFEDPTEAVQRSAALIGLGQRLADPRPWERSDTSDTAKVTLPASIDELDAMEILDQAGIPTASARRARDAAQAAAAAEALGFPVVLKIASADIVHKSDIGGAKLHLTNADQVRAAFDDVMRAAAAQCPEAQVDGVLVARMLPAGVEMAIGVNNDPTFGPMVMAGIGGVLIEVLRDVAFELAPFDKPEALAMLRRLRGYAILQGARGAPPADVDALANALVQLSRFAWAHADRIESIDINPLMVFAEGDGIAAADAVIVPRN